MAGFNTELIRKNKEANGRLLGVKLGRLCIKNGYSVSYVAKKLGVSRQTIYNWFVGKGNPTEDQFNEVEMWL